MTTKILHPLGGRPPATPGEHAYLAAFLKVKTRGHDVAEAMRELTAARDARATAIAHLGPADCTTELAAERWRKAREVSLERTDALYAAETKLDEAFRLWASETAARYTQHLPDRVVGPSSSSTDRPAEAGPPCASSQ